MVSGIKVEGGTQILSAGVRKTIQQIKEIVGNHSDADIYVALKETNMDPNETTQKLLNQDPFHEVKRKRDKKKENPYRAPVAADPRRTFDHVGQAVKSSTYSDRNVRTSGYNRDALPVVSREFRVVRDNRVNQNANKESKPVESSASSSGPVAANISAKSNSATISINQKPPFGRHAFQTLNGPTESPPRRQPRDVNSSGTLKKDVSGDTRQIALDGDTQTGKPNESQLPSVASSNNSVVGVYSSSLDPVHVPSPDSRSAAKVGAIKREVGVVGAHRQNSDRSPKLSSPHSNALSSTHLGREGSSSREAVRSIGTLSKNEQTSQSIAPQSAVPSLPVSRSFSNNQQSSRSHQLSGHQKAPQPNKEWKPKSSQKSSANGPGIIGTPKKSAPPPLESSKDEGTEVSQLEDKMSRVNVFENQNVIIAAHIRVSETDRCRLTFGSLGTDFETRKSGYQTSGRAEEPHTEPSGCLPVSSASESSNNEAGGSKQLDLIDDHVRNSGSGSPVSVSASDQVNGKKEGSQENLNNYADMGLVEDASPPYAPPESRQQQDDSELQSFSAYDPSQTGYEVSYFRPTVEEHVHGQGLPSTQEALSSHPANIMPSSSILTAQQQQQQQQQQAVAQMYPQQLHVSHFANVMPYRHLMPPVYVPPMVPGYSNSPAYPHPSNGSSYILMPGSSSHLTTKYGIQQFKPVPTGSPTGFGNFTSPTGYAVNTPGVIGSATGLEDTSRLKYKDGNIYVPNPQAETSEIWMSPRDLQSASFYNMTGQTPHHAAAAYMPSHSGHTSYNAAAVAQSSHMQFPGLYHSPLQAAAIGNPHHLSPAAMGGNVGVGVAAAAPGAQVGAYQQPQLGHLNWTGNF